MRNVYLICFEESIPARSSSKIRAQSLGWQTRASATHQLILILQRYGNSRSSLFDRTAGHDAAI